MILLEFNELINHYLKVKLFYLNGLKSHNMVMFLVGWYSIPVFGQIIDLEC